MKRDIELNYLESGENNDKVLILLHGNGESASCFEKQISDFSRYFHVFALDTRGHGKSPRGNRPFTLNQFSKDLKDFIRQHHIVKPHILGFSDGANIALLYALKNRENLDRLILNGGNLFPLGVEDEELKYFSERYSVLSEKKDRESRKEAELISLMVNEPHINPESLDGIDSRVLVVAGVNDCIKKEHTQLIACSLPNSELSFLPGDHFVAYNNPEIFNRRILQFLLSEN